MGERMADTGISVRGSGTVSRTPDQATLTIGVDAIATAAGEAQTAASTHMTAVTAALREAGVAPADVVTGQVTLGPRYDYTGDTPRLIGYQASQTLRVRARRLDALGVVIDRAVGAGATTVQDVTLGIAETSGAEDEARALAIADARRKARVLADAAGVTIGAPTLISEEVGGMPMPVAFKAAAMAADASTPVAAGSTDITVGVQVTFAMVAGDRPASGPEG
jgi:uncharacterized protein